MQQSSKTIPIALGITFVILFASWYPDQFDQTARAAVVTAARLFALVMAAVWAYQAFDSFRSGIKGVQSETSAPVENPTDPSERRAAIHYGIILSAVSLSLVVFAVVLLP